MNTILTWKTTHLLSKNKLYQNMIMEHYYKANF